MAVLTTITVRAFSKGRVITAGWEVTRFSTYKSGKKPELLVKTCGGPLGRLMAAKAAEEAVRCTLADELVIEANTAEDARAMGNLLGPMVSLCERTRKAMTEGADSIRAVTKERLEA